MTGTVPEIIVLNDYATLTGGSTAVAIASATELAQRGFKVTYFSCVGPVAPQLQGVPGLEVVCLGQWELAKNPRRLQAAFSGLRNGGAVRALRRLLSGRDPARTLVHAHTWMKALSPAALETVTARGFPLVVTLHDFFITCPNGGFFEHSTGRICLRQPLSLACLGCECDRHNQAQKLWRFARIFLQNRLFSLPQQVAHYVGVSHFSLDRLRPHLPAATPATVVRNPVDFADRGPSPVAANRAFLFIGRLVPEKGVRLLAQAARATGLPVTFVGEGELLPELRQLCPQARFTGWLDAAGIRAELARARALVFPSLWYETLGLVAIEAAAAGVPTLVADGCAATDHIRHEENGLHFTHGSATSLAGAMQRLAADDALAARLGAAAYRWYWRDPWTAERHVDDLLEVYRSLDPRSWAAEGGTRPPDAFQHAPIGKTRPEAGLHHLESC